MFLRRLGATLSWCTAVLGALVSTAGAATLLVPGDFPTIQDAMNAAQAGDVVLVADGVYTGSGNKHLFFPGPFGFTLRSENGPENCIIDMEGSGAAFFFVADEPASAIILRPGTRSITPREVLRRNRHPSRAAPKWPRDWMVGSLDLDPSRTAPSAARTTCPRIDSLIPRESGIGSVVTPRARNATKRKTQ